MMKILALCTVLAVFPTTVMANNSPNVVATWATIVQQSIHNATAPRSAGTSQVLHTMVMLAVYDAVVAIEGGYAPYAAELTAPADADVRAAVATAAYLTARSRIAASQIPSLDQQYVAYLATIPEGTAKAAGIAVGEQSAAAMIALRTDDGFSNVVLYECSAVPPPPGEFVPDTGCPSGPTSPQPADVKLGFIRPFAIENAARYRPDGPAPMTSGEYADDFEETREYGRRDSAVRTAEQTDIAYFWSEHPYVHWNRNLVALAVSRDLNVRDTARFFAMVHTAVSDAIIAGFAAKYHYNSWRPRTAIPQADADASPETDADPTWLPLLTVNHPEYPSGHGFWSGALVDTVATFFGRNKLDWTITTSKVAVPVLVRTERTYQHAKALTKEISDARVWGGLHWRHSIRDGEQIGRRVSAYVAKHFFTKAR